MRVGVGVGITVAVGAGVGERVGSGDDRAGEGVVGTTSLTGGVVGAGVRQLAKTSTASGAAIQHLRIASMAHSTATMTIRKKTTTAISSRGVSR